MQYYVMYRRGQLGFYTCYALMLHEWVSDKKHYLFDNSGPSDSLLMVPPATWSVDYEEAKEEGEEKEGQPF